MAIYRLPLNEVVFDFYDRLKSISRGYASFDYEIENYRASDLVKVVFPLARSPSTTTTVPPLFKELLSKLLLFMALCSTSAR